MKTTENWIIKGKGYLYLLMVILALSVTATSCTNKKKAIPFWFAALSGEESGGGSKSGSNKGTDSNGVTLPGEQTNNTGSGQASTSTSTPSTQNNLTSTQEVPTHGAAQITGKITPQIGSLPICAAGQEPGNPPVCAKDTGNTLDLTKVEVKLVKNGNQVVATTKPNADGTYTFDIPDLNNGTYNVVISQGNGLKSASTDVSFTYDPTAAGGKTKVEASNLSPERLYLPGGPAQITGKIIPELGDLPICKDGQEPGNPPVCVKEKQTALDLTQVDVKLVDRTTDQIVAAGKANADGTFSFELANLSNGNYKVVVSGTGIESTSQDFVYTFKSNSPTEKQIVALPDLNVQRSYSSGPAIVQGNIIPTIWGLPICKDGQEPPSCANERETAVDLTKVDVKIYQNGVEIATVKANADGSYKFDLSNLNNGTYRVLINSGNGLSYAYQDFNFSSPGSQATVNVPDLKTERLYSVNGGPAFLSGKIVPKIGDTPICINGQPAGCIVDSGTPLDLTKVEVKLIKNENGQEVVVKSTFLSSTGNYAFDLPDLNNGDYRILINTGNGLNYAYKDISYSYDSTKLGQKTSVVVDDIGAERLYLTSGSAIISGNIKSAGYQGDGVTVPSGVLSGIKVELKDSNGNVVATATTDQNGNYAFCFHVSSGCPAGSGSTTSSSYLNNGNYTIAVDGDSQTVSGRPFNDQDLFTPFKFSGNNQDTATTVVVPETTLTWNAATSSSATIKIPVRNAAVDDTTTVYTVKVKDAAGNVVGQTTVTGNGLATISVPNLVNGVYSVEVSSSTAIASGTSAFNFVPNPTGGNKDVNIPTISIAPKPSNVTGTIQGPGGVPNPVPGAVVNFRPDESQPPVDLAYLALAQGDDANTVRLRNLANMWIREACTHVSTCQTNCASQGYQVSCVIANQGTGPWQYDTYVNKVYEINGSQLYFSAVAGKWDYYVSAPGYENTPVATMLLNGETSVTVPPITMVTSDRRSQIQGSVVVLDMLVGSTSYTPYTNVSGLFAVMLGNNDNSGNPVAHVTITSNGSFAFGGSSKVVSLTGVTDVNHDGQINDTDRILYAIGAYTSAPTLGSASNVAGEGTGNSVDSTGGYYNFKQSSYQIVIADPLGHILTTPKPADNSSVVTNTYTNGQAVLNLTGIQVPHQSRRQISGTITDAISTSAVEGATVTLGVMDSNNTFQQTVRRDCTSGTAGDATTCSMPTTRASGQDQIVPSVTTAANGSYTINNIDPGTYVLKISKNGIDTYIPVTVPSTGSQTVVNGQVVTSSGRGNLTGTVKTPNTGGTLVNFTGTYSLEIVHPSFGTRPTSGVQPASLASGATIFTNVPVYNIFSINAGTWKVRFVSSGYTTVEALVNIQANATTTLDIVTMVPGYHPPATVSGRALSAMTQLGIGGLTVNIRSGVNVTSGPYVGSSVTTASDGSYALPNVPSGDYTLEVSGAGYATTYRTVVSAGPDTPPNQDIVVSPILGVDEVRVVLTWGEKPRDVDSHLEYGSSTCKTASGKACQVVWNDRCHLGSGTCNNGAGAGNPTYDAALDVDDTTSYGPETITLKGTFWTSSVVTRRGYSLYNWSNEATLSASAVTVRVYKTSGLVRSYTVSPTQTNRWWHVFCLSSDKSVTDVGQPGCNNSDFFDKAQN